LNGNEPLHLESDVIQALEQGRTIQAIKLLRAHRAIGLKEAKELIETYLELNPHLRVEKAKNSTGLIFLIAIVFIAYALYRILILSQ